MNSPLLIEFGMAHDILRHDCVRIRGIVISQGIFGSTAFFLTFVTKVMGLQNNAIPSMWCLLSLFVGVSTFIAICHSRITRLGLIGRVNFLRTALFRTSLLDIDRYLAEAGFGTEIVPYVRFFLVPQLVGVAAFILLTFLALTWLYA